LEKEGYNSFSSKASKGKKMQVNEESTTKCSYNPDLSSIKESTIMVQIKAID